MKSFKIGGIHPSENKLSKDRTIERLPLPVQGIVPLIQHIGAPAVPVVAKGDKVKVGTLLGRAGGYVSANIHSPFSGTVLKIDQAMDTGGYNRLAVFIAIEGDDWEDSIDRSDVLKPDIFLSGKEVIERITSAGITGMGGATFPTHVKLTPPLGTQAEVLIMNGAECEPYLTSDYRLMMEKGEEIMVGIRLLMKASGVERAIIGIENNKKDAIESLTKISGNYPEISVAPLKTRYPQGGEKQLIDALIHRQVPGGALPVSVGAVVHNVGTAYAVYEAVQKNKPLIERVVTVTGKNLSKPSNVWARIGTPVGKLIEYAGGLPGDAGKIIAGGPMMGKALAGLDVPVTKGCSGILVLSSDEAVRKPARDCIRCAKCVAVCPMGLVPSYLMNVTEYEAWDKAQKFAIMDCIECGSCSYSCPANRPLLDFIRLGKNKVSKLHKSN